MFYLVSKTSPLGRKNLVKSLFESIAIFDLTHHKSSYLFQPIAIIIVRQVENCYITDDTAVFDLAMRQSLFDRAPEIQSASRSWILPCLIFDGNDYRFAVVTLVKR
jgi:hypothetical protein